MHNRQLRGKRKEEYKRMQKAVTGCDFPIENNKKKYIFSIHNWKNHIIFQSIF